MSESPSSSADGGGGGDHPAAVVDLVGGRRSVTDPSSSRARSAAETVWPEHFLEAVAARVAVDAAEAHGRLAAAPAVATLFQVCSTWRSVSRSELLWEEVTQHVWSSHRRLLSSWHDEFRRRHRTALNFRICRCTHAHILPPSGDTISCRRLALSDSYIAAGFSDGTVRLFFLPTAQHLATYRPHPLQTRLGLYSPSISGLVLLTRTTGDRLVYAFQDGDVHIASLDDPFTGPAGRRANVGNPVDDGPLVDFSCNSNSRWWVGLFAGVPGRSWHVWDGDTEQLVYVGGSLTDPDSVMGWRMLTDLRGPALGRVRIPELGIAVGCTGSRIQVIDLDGDMGGIVSYREFQRGAIVDAFDACDGKVMVVDQLMMAKVRMARSWEEVRRFSTARRGEVQANANANASAVGCMNWGYAVVCSSSSEEDGGGGGQVWMWDAVSGEFLYSFRERIGDTSVVGASDRYVSAWSGETGLHIWDFGGV